MRKSEIMSIGFDNNGLKWKLLVLLVLAAIAQSNTSGKKNADLLEDITDLKAFKKLLRSRTNILIFLAPNINEFPNENKILQEVAEQIRGFGVLAAVSCDASGERKKVCKKLKVAPKTYILKHFKDGEFHKDYDRKMTVTSMLKFMKDPTGDIPWEEDDRGKDVVHFEDYLTFTRHIRKDQRPMMLMFYAPWCGFCKQLKGPYSEAAKILKESGRVLAAMDMDRKENVAARRVFNITGFPTLAYFEKGFFKHIYKGDNNKEAIINFMLNPNVEPKNSKKDEVKETPWSADANSEIVHLTTQGFDPVLKDEKSVLVMFYAPWCGHCKRMKPEYEKAAAIMKEKKIPGVLAAIDTTKETSIGQRFEITGFPTLKYFVDGEYKFDVNFRSTEKLVEFMRDPKEPPPPDKKWEEEEDSEYVVFLNDENFNTLKRKKHALVMFFAPWCGHCKSTKPEFNAAARSLKDDTKIAFAAVDCTRQSSICARYKVQSYPTFYYFSYLKNQLPYNGGRTRKDFVEFMTNGVTAQSKEEL